jgi:hypothetical protein
MGKTIKDGGMEGCPEAKKHMFCKSNFRSYKTGLLPFQDIFPLFHLHSGSLNCSPHC